MINKPGIDPYSNKQKLDPFGYNSMKFNMVIMLKEILKHSHFLQQVNLAEQLTSSDFGVSTGLISQGYWENSKWCCVNVEGGNIADKLQPRNSNISFTNNSNVAIDILIFTFYSDQLVIDVEIGIVNK
jgi:hypothetical protein